MLGFVEKIVVLGGGFGGLTTLMHLARSRPNDAEVELVLVDRHLEHLYTPLLYEIASGCLLDNGRVCRGKLKEGATISFEKCFKQGVHGAVSFVQGEVVAIDHSRKRLRFDGREDIFYDTLVVALGSQTNYYQIEGLRENSLSLKSLRESFVIRARLHDFLERCQAGQEKCLDVVVAGAGATGTELSAELANFFQHLTRRGELERSAWSIRLVDRGSEILSAFSPKVRRIARERLRRLGVEVVLNSQIEEVKDRTIRMCVDQATVQTTEADAVIWCGGIAPNNLLQDSGLPLAPGGQLLIDETCRVHGFDHLFALGDCARLVTAGAGASSPPLAQVAIAQAVIVAKNIWRHRAGKSLRTWKPKRVWRTILPLGGAYAVADLGFFVLRGRPAYLLRCMVDWWYWHKILPFHAATHTWWQGVRTYLQND